MQSNILYKVSEESYKKYEEKPVYFTKPRIVALYGFENGRLTKAKNIKYFCIPSPDKYPLDLNMYDESYSANMNVKRLEATLRYAMTCDNEAEKAQKTKVYTRRGTLRRMMQYNYKLERDKILVSRYNNNLYVQREKFDELHDSHPVHGHHIKFKSILFKDTPNGVPTDCKNYDPNVRLYSVHRCNFGKYDMIYSGDFSGIHETEKTIDVDDLDAVNGSRSVVVKQIWENYKAKDTKYMDYWIQSYLGGSEDVYIGYKNDSALICKPIKHIKSKDLCKNMYWFPHVCTGFLYEFLYNVEKLMSDVNCLNTVYSFRYNYHGKFFTYEVFENNPDKNFIPDDYKAFIGAVV